MDPKEIGKKVADKNPVSFDKFQANPLLYFLFLPLGALFGVIFFVKVLFQGQITDLKSTVAEQKADIKLLQYQKDSLLILMGKKQAVDQINKP